MGECWTHIQASNCVKGYKYISRLAKKQRYWEFEPLKSNWCGLPFKAIVGVSGEISWNPGPRRRGAPELFLVDLRKNGAGLVVFDDRYRMQCQDLRPNGRCFKQGFEIVGFIQRKTTATIHVVPSSEQRHTFRWFSLSLQELID